MRGFIEPPDPPEHDFWLDDVWWREEPVTFGFVCEEAGCDGLAEWEVVSTDEDGTYCRLLCDAHLAQMKGETG